MRTDDLIAALAGDVAPVPRGAVPRRMALGLAGGGAVTLLLVAMWLGVRPDLGRADARLSVLDEVGIHDLARGDRGGGDDPSRATGSARARAGWPG